jgi:uridine phosphorylase
MDRVGTYDALQAAIDVGATIIDAGSSVAASITGGCPFQLYFVVKRLF